MITRMFKGGFKIHGSPVQVSFVYVTMSTSRRGTRLCITLCSHSSISSSDMKTVKACIITCYTYALLPPTVGGTDELSIVHVNVYSLSFHFDLITVL
jgi:hypothetical protein